MVLASTLFSVASYKQQTQTVVRLSKTVLSESYGGRAWKILREAEEPETGRKERTAQPRIQPHPAQALLVSSPISSDHTTTVIMAAVQEQTLLALNSSDLFPSNFTYWTRMSDSLC